VTLVLFVLIGVTALRRNRGHALSGAMSPAA
jgi:hypothetical protein